MCGAALLTDQPIALGFCKGICTEARNRCIGTTGIGKDKPLILSGKISSGIRLLSLHKRSMKKKTVETVWSAPMDADCLSEFPIDEELKEIAWKHVDPCASLVHAAEAKKGRLRRMFENVCQCTFRFDNPDAYDLRFYENDGGYTEKGTFVKKPYIIIR